jgi:hypothetical protein
MSSDNDAKSLLSAADILGAEDLVPVEVDVPEWGGTIRIRPLSAAEALTFIESLKKRQEEGAMRILIASAIDAAGKQLFTEADVHRLKAKSLRALMRVQNAAMQLNGLSEAAAATAKNV